METFIALVIVAAFVGAAVFVARKSRSKPRTGSGGGSPIDRPPQDIR